MVIHPISLGFVQAYLIETPPGLVLVDCGMSGHEKSILKEMKQLGRDDLKLIFITHAHADHYGSAGALKRLTGAQIGMHFADAQNMLQGTSLPHVRSRIMQMVMSIMRRFSKTPLVEVDILLQGGDDLTRFGLPHSLVIHTPGHSPGSVTLVLEDKTAFVGDLISTTGKAHLQRSIVDNWEQLRETFIRLQGLKLNKIYVGHGRRSLSGEELERLIDLELELIRP
jgi:hydroxyacylglutathione hydrolase